MRAVVVMAFTAVLAYAQGGNLALTGGRATFGLLGPTRPDSKVLPGDTLWLEFDIEGITVSPDGKVQYSMGLEVADPKGKVIFAQKPTDQEGLASLGGKSVPGHAQVDVGLGLAAGDYTVKVSVADKASKQGATLSHKMQVQSADFGIIQLKLTGDPGGIIPAGLVSTGESVWVNLGVVGFARDKGKQQPHLEFEMRVLDETGKPTLAKPDSGVINQDVPPTDKLIGAQFLISPNRPGKFTVELKAVDKIAGKSAAASFPLTVSPRR